MDNTNDKIRETLTNMNPWWENADALPVVPETRRHLVSQIQKRMQIGLAPVVMIRGSRQIGKTTSQLQVIKDILEKGIPPRHICRIQFDEISFIKHFDDPILSLAYWYEKEILKEKINLIANKKGACVYFFFDEIQNVDNWAPQLKHLVDINSCQAVVTGSSALRIEKGKDSLAGRITTLNVGLLSLTEIGILRKMKTPAPYMPDNGLEKLTKKEFWIGLGEYGLNHINYRDTVFKFFSQRGAYPIAHINPELEWGFIADQLNETIIQRVIQHDLRSGEKGRKRDVSLLEELFRLCCRYAGQNPLLTTLVRELQQTLNANIGPQKALNYLRFLSDILLVNLIMPLEIRLKKKKSSPKFCIADHSLRASWLQENISLTGNNQNQAEDTIAGHLAESIVGAFLSTIHGLAVAYLPERNREPEVDFVITIGQHRIPIEIKYQNSVESKDTLGIKHFMNQPLNNASFGLVITKNDRNIMLEDNIMAIPLKSFLLMR